MVLQVVRAVALLRAGVATAITNGTSLGLTDLMRDPECISRRRALAGPEPPATQRRATESGQGRLPEPTRTAECGRSIH